MAAVAVRSLWRAPASRLFPSRAGGPFPCRAFSASTGPTSGTEYRSQYSLEKLYPPQREGSGAVENCAKETIFSIPVDRLSVSYCRSSGPGGQNVNKVNTKAEVRFHLASADWIKEDVREKMAVMQKNKISKSGELIVTSEVSRYQMRNLADCLQKIRDMITEATEKPKIVTEEDEEAMKIRIEKMNRERLRQKKIHSSLKQSRRVDFD